MKNKQNRLFIAIAAAFSCVPLSSHLMANVANDDHPEKHAHVAENTTKHSDEHGEEHNKNNIDKHGHSDEHKDDHKDEHGHAEEHKEGHVEITSVNAKNAGIVNEVAGAAQIKKTITVYGKTRVKPNSISQVSARFAGLITQLTVNVGDTVNAGDIIAQVESNNSFKRYTIVAPIAGIVTQRNANPGEITGQKPLVVIENYDELWVEFMVFPSQKNTQFAENAVKQGMTVMVSSSNISDTSLLENTTSTQLEIGHVLANKSQPYTNAIAVLDNKKNQWAAGQLLTGSIVISEQTVNLAIDNRAFQEVEGKQVIFVVKEHGYETRELGHQPGSDITLGQTDGYFTQVVSGLRAGEQYAVKNSYLLKADLGKAGAAHVH